MKDQSWIADLLTGYKQLIDGNGNPVERRPTLALDSGFSVADDATNKVTRLIANASPLTETTADYVQPSVGGSVVVSVVSNATIAVGLGAFVVTGGMYQVTNVNVDGVHITLKNNGDAGNASPGTTITHPQKVIAAAEGTSGPPGPAPPGVGPIVNQVSATPIALSATEGQAAVMVGGIPQAVGVWPVFRPESYGAKRDGVTDDATAIQAAANACLAAGGGQVLFSAGTYLINAPVIFGNPAGPAASMLISGQGVHAFGTTILAGSIINQMFTVSDLLVKMENLYLNGNNKARDGILRQGDALGHYHQVTINNCTRDGFHGLNRYPFTGLSSVTQTGPGPAIAISVYDPELYPTSQTPWVLRIETPGALGTATASLSIGGGPFSAAQTLEALIHVGVPDGSNYVRESGFAAACAAGTYQAGTTYSWTFTNSVISPTGPNNDTTMFINCQALTCGQQFYGTGVDPTSFWTPIATAGTVSVTAGSQIITGSGTSFLSLGARSGDTIFVGNPRTVGTAALYVIACVLDDTHIAIDPNWTPTANLSGQLYAIGVGAGYWEGGSADHNTCMIRGGRYSFCSTGIRFCGPYAGTVIGGQVDNLNMIGILDQSGDGGIYQRVYNEGGDDAFAYYIAMGASATIVDPAGATANSINVDDTSAGLVTGPGSANLTFGNVQIPYHNFRSSPKINKLSLATDATIVVTSGTVLPAPNKAAIASVLTLAGSAPLTLTSNPCIQPPKADGDIVILRNIHTAITIPSNEVAGSGIILEGEYVTIGDSETLVLFGFNGLWYQLGAMGRAQIGHGCLGEITPAMVTTTDATPTNIMQVDVADRATLRGLDIVVRAVCTTSNDYCYWFLRGTWGPWHGGLIDFQWSTEQIRGSGAGGGAPLGWTAVLTTTSATFGNVIATGDGAHTVQWIASAKSYGMHTGVG